MPTSSSRNGVLRFAADYHRTWNATGDAGRFFLLGGLLYLIRSQAFAVAFPLYAKEQGYSQGEIGLFLAAFQFALFVLGVPFTFLGGRGLTRKVLTVTPLFSVAGLVLILLAPDGSTLLAALGALLAGASGASFWVLGDPLLAHTTPPGERANVYALKFFMLTLAVSLGSGLGGWIPGFFDGVIGFSAIRALTITVVAFMLMDALQMALYARIPAYEEAKPRRSTSLNKPKPRGGRAWLPWAIMLAFAVPEVGMALGHNSIRPFLSLFFKNEHNFSSSATGTVIAVLGLVSGAGALAAPRIATRLGNFRAIALYRVTGSVMILLWFTGVGLPPVLGLMLIYYLMMDGSEAIYIAESMGRMPASRRSWFSGIYAMAWSISASSASVLSGEIQDRNDERFGMAFAVGAFGYLFSVFWMTIVLPRLPSMRDPEPPASARTDEPAVAVA
jgi:predicted MFS family arabinose efflux permease